MFGPAQTTHAGYLNRCILGRSASWKSSLSSAALMVNSRCFSFRFCHVSAGVVEPRNQRVMAGSDEPDGDWAYELSVDGAEADVGGEGRKR